MAKKGDQPPRIAIFGAAIDAIIASARETGAAEIFAAVGGKAPPLPPAVDDIAQMAGRDAVRTAALITA